MQGLLKKGLLLFLSHVFEDEGQVGGERKQKAVSFGLLSESEGSHFG